MLKITNANVTRLSEDHLYLALAEEKDGSNLFVLIEAELDRRAELHTQALKKKQVSQIESLKLTQEIQSEIQEIFKGYRGIKTLFLIENLGQEFIEDYTIDEETFTVYSKVSHEVFNNPSSWELDSIERARAKVARLIYYRIYEKFMRDATPNNLELLKRVLGG